MSLKAFHVLFITAASAMSVGFGIWMLRDFAAPEGVRSELYYGIGGLVVGVGLLVYEGFFLKKLKNVSYL